MTEWNELFVSSLLRLDCFYLDYGASFYVVLYPPVHSLLVKQYEQGYQVMG